MTLVVPSYRCGAVPEWAIHRTGFPLRSSCSARHRNQTQDIVVADGGQPICAARRVGGRGDPEYGCAGPDPGCASAGATWIRTSAAVFGIASAPDPSSSANRLTSVRNHNILCLVAVSGTTARPKRESGAVNSPFRNCPAAVTGNDQCHSHWSARCALGSGIQ